MVPQGREMGFGQSSPGFIVSELMEPLKKLSRRDGDLDPRDESRHEAAWLKPRGVPPQTLGQWSLAGLSWETLPFALALGEAELLPPELCGAVTITIHLLHRQRFPLAWDVAEIQISRLGPLFYVRIVQAGASQKDTQIHEKISATSQHKANLLSGV